MRIAVYHNLPAGGARRVLWEHLRRTADYHEYEVFSIDEGQAEGSSGGRARTEHDLAPFVKQIHSHPVRAFPGTGPVQDLLIAGAVHRAQRAIAGEIDSGGFDLAYVHGCRRTQSPMVLAHLRTPTVYFMQEVRRRSHETGYGSVPGRPASLRSLVRYRAERWVTVADRRAVLAATEVLCNSSFSLESIARAYGRWPRICPLGVDTSVFGPGSGQRGNSVIAVGAIEVAKAHDLVIKALAMLPPDRRPTLEIVFERAVPAVRGQIEALAADLGVELQLTQGISDLDLADRYRAAGAAVCAARLEPFGLTSIEALASGTPVVAVREGGFREVVQDGVDGVLVERDPEAMAAGIEAVLSGAIAIDEQHRTDVAAFWSWSRSVERLLSVFDQVVESRR